MLAAFPEISIQQFQLLIREIYGLPNDRHFELSELLTNVQRFAMRGLKGIRKNEVEKTKNNLIISFSFFISTLNRLHIELDDIIWERFPYLCFYCGNCPCICKKSKEEFKKQQPIVDANKRPKKIRDYQKMFSEIYPAETRTIENAGVHLAEEIGEFSEALLGYRGDRRKEDFEEVIEEAADYFSCLLGVFNSLGIDLAYELSKIFTHNCHVCYKAPCECTFVSIRRFKS